MFHISIFTQKLHGGVPALRNAPGRRLGVSWLVYSPGKGGPELGAVSGPIGNSGAVK
jgi:hypothetical protein